MKKMKVRTVVIVLLAIMFLVGLVSCAEEENCENGEIQEGDLPIIISGKIIAGKDAGNFNINGGEVELTEDYSGKIEIGENGGKIIDLSVRDYGGGSTRLENREHEFTKGIIEVRNGKIVSIRNADIKESKLVFRFKIKTDGEPFDEEVTISGENINYDSSKKILTSNKRLKIGGGRLEHFRISKEIVSENNQEFILDFSGDFPVFETRGNLVKVSEKGENFGKLNGRFTFIDRGGKGYKEEVDFSKVYLSPSEGKEHGFFEMRDMKGKISETTIIDDTEESQAEGKTFYGISISGVKSSVIFNGELDIYIKDNNEIELEFARDRFHHFNQHLIEDESEVKVITTFEGGLESEVFLSKDKPLAKNLKDIGFPIGVQFKTGDGKTWSWEYNPEKKSPEIKEPENVLYIVGEAKRNFLNLPFEGNAGYPDPKSGKFLKDGTNIDLWSKEIISSHIIEQEEVKDPKEKFLAGYLYYLDNVHGIKKTIVEEGQRPHEYIVDYRLFTGLDSFTNALSEPPKEDGFDRLIINVHGNVDKMVTTDREGKDTKILVSDIKNIPEETREGVRENINSVSTCYLYSCLLFGNIDKPNEENMGLELVRLLGKRSYGSVPTITGGSQYRQLISERWVIAEPIEEGKIKVTDVPKGE